MENLMAVWSWLTSVLTTEFFAALAAALSFFVAWRQHVWNKKHHLASFRPFICDLLERNQEELSLSFSVMNKGLGPAKIISYEFEWDGVKIERNEVRKLIIRNFNEDFRFYLAEMSNLSVFSAGESRQILSVMKKCSASIAETDREKFSNLNMLLIEHFRIVIRYQSIQGRKIFEYKTTPLKSLLREAGIKQ